MSDLWRPQFSAQSKRDASQPTDEDVVKALVEIQNASSAPMPSADSPIHVVAEGSSRKWLVIAAALAMVAAVGYIGKQEVIRLAQIQGRKIVRGTAVRSDGPVQIFAEQLLAKAAAGDTQAATDVLQHSPEWTGKTQRTPRSEQLVTAMLNQRDLQIRQAGVRAELALDGVPADATGLDQVKMSIGNPQQRVWALWMLGALANQGVDPDHTSKVIETYLTDPDVPVRAAAVDAMALVATSETIPMILDRFRNDPSPVVQERAACDLAESGMYTHAQRMSAASSLVGWVDDSLLTSQQRAWAVQALGDISGQHFGNDAAAWRRWYESAKE
jgi:HEAT repeat protein